MDTAMASGLWIAAVGVVGTLLSSLLTQRAADGSRRRERVEERREQERRAGLDARRDTYVALNTACRQYLAALTDQMHALLNADGSGASGRRLTEARDAHRDCYAEAQLRVPDPVLDLAGTVNHSLSTTYGMLMRLDRGDTRPGDSLDAVRADIEALWRQVRLLRQQMRADLGVVNSGEGG
ncbi:hypothetical protein [Streptomyces sp. NPDC001828]|uniref:hypothetical protein n=1 Tax=Streptomyces sp. NPDC001828 TaxID=3364615 RepID=UPI0036C3E9FE